MEVRKKCEVECEVTFVEVSEEMRGKLCGECKQRWVKDVKKATWRV